MPLPLTTVGARELLEVPLPLRLLVPITTVGARELLEVPRLVLLVPKGFEHGWCLQRQ